MKDKLQEAAEKYGNSVTAGRDKPMAQILANSFMRGSDWQQEQSKQQIEQLQ